MRLSAGLSRQIILSMSAVVLGMIVFVLVSANIFYAWLWQLGPSSAAIYGGWLPSEPEWIWMASIIAIGFIAAVVTAFRLSQRILIPLNSVIENLRRVAQGDLGARAIADDRSIGEAAQLVDDFNVMAGRLQRMASELVIWNAAVAHELRTPVTILRGRLQGLAEGVFTPDASQFSSLLAQVESLARLIEDLRVLSLADSGHLDLQLEQSHLADEIRSVAQSLEPILQAAGFTIALALDDRPVRCDALRIRQALLVLLDNARRYAHPCSLHVEMVLNGGMCQLRVEDEGPGIDDTLAAHIFDAFQRGEDSRSRLSGGSGLGLAVVRAIAQAHKGKVSCERGRRGGALFEIAFPQ